MVYYCHGLKIRIVTAILGRLLVTGGCMGKNRGRLGNRKARKEKAKKKEGRDKDWSKDFGLILSFSAIVVVFVWTGTRTRIGAGWWHIGE